jgi:hypothetical protein
MKAFTTSILAAFALIILQACSRPEQSAIVGHWHELGTTAVAAFHEDGTVEISTGESQVSGTYSFITDGKMKIELSGKGAALGPRVYQFTVSGDKMTWIDVDGQKSEYLRAR